MNLCEDGHEEICFNGRNCPLCDKIKDTDAEIEALNNKIDDLKQQIDQLTTE